MKKEHVDQKIYSSVTSKNQQTEEDGRHSSLSEDSQEEDEEAVKQEFQNAIQSSQKMASINLDKPASEGRRHSSKIFSLARNMRINQMYKYAEVKRWDFENIFKYESDEIKQEITFNKRNLFPGEYINYVPEREELMLPHKSFKQRLIYYC